MSTVRVEVNGIDDLVHNLSMYPPKVVEACVVAAQMTQAHVVNDAKADHPYVDRTGNLTKSIQPGDVVVTDDDVTAYVEARMSYASYVEFGTSRAAAYPFLVPAVLRNSDYFKKQLKRQIDSVRL